MRIVYYVQPSKPILASKLDFTDPYQIEAAYELGKNDGAQFWESIQNGATSKEVAQTLHEYD